MGQVEVAENREPGRAYSVGLCAVYGGQCAGELFLVEGVQAALLALAFPFAELPLGGRRVPPLGGLAKLGICLPGRFHGLSEGSVHRSWPVADEAACGVASVWGELWPAFGPVEQVVFGEQQRSGGQGFGT
ncbi:hypothetical protein DBP12_36960 [Streptomyces sp. CS014]|nr:hypothetical protein DBP12_36960 [Streptomyces sp. CS014]